MERISIAQFKERLKAQGMPNNNHMALVCPICATVQSMDSLVAAGAPEEKVESYIGFSCVGRFNGAGPHRKGAPSGKGCDWTLGGLFRLHQLEVIDEEGKAHPRFRVATPEEAHLLYSTRQAEPANG